MGGPVWLERLNRRHVLAHAGAVPEAFKGVMDEATYAKSVQYTLAKGRLEQIEATWDAAVLLVRAVQRRAAVGLSGVQRKGWAVRRGRMAAFLLRHGRGAVAAGPAAGLV